MSKYLEIIWASTHNLKNISVKIPKNKLTVITGLSWSGKSSFAFNTIHTVWQQKFFESLSTYARMFVWWMKEEAIVEEIHWLSPTISIDQKTTSRNPRSTVWTITEIYDYYKLLFLNLWDRKCVECWNWIKKDSLNDVISDLLSYPKQTKFVIKSPLFKNEIWLTNDVIKAKVLELWFIRFSVNNQVFNLNDKFEINTEEKNNVDIIVDRLMVWEYEDKNSSDCKRLIDSLELAFKVGQWFINIDIHLENKIEEKKYSNIFVCSECWHIPKELNISNFSFNSHAWACQNCHWLWEKLVFLEENIINYNLTLDEWAVIAPWFWWDTFFNLLKEVSKSTWIRLNIKYPKLTKEERKILLYWTWKQKYTIRWDFWAFKEYSTVFEWVITTLNRRYLDSTSETWVYDDYLTSIECDDCHWFRLNSESLSVYFKWLNIWELSNYSVDKALDFFKSITLTKSEKQIVAKVMKNIIERLEFLAWVWLNYMTIDRKANTLSGWESQRIRLATQIWTRLEWIIYILDEPSIWLHPRDNDMLIANLKKLRDIWNTLIVVEHDEDIMRESDHIIDVWPWAWIHWWNIVFEWTFDEIIKDEKSLTWKYLSKQKNILISRQPRLIKNHLEIKNASHHNLKNIDVKIPLSNLVTVTWVSGSWKSSLVNDILANYLLNKLNRAQRNVWKVWEIIWLEYLDKALVIDQWSIWKTPRSNPATYTGVFNLIRDVFSQTQEAQIRWYWPWRFSFNTRDWRCDICDWDWVKKIEMHFLPPVYVTCEVCDWKRFNKETLQVTYKWKSISDVLNMSVEEALDFFRNHPKIVKILQVLNDVWLGYIKLWQSSTTLSGWESQRIKLATELSKRSTSKTFYILDEPTTWLHFGDVEKLLTILHSLVDKGNTVLVIEHNLDVILNSDYIIDIWQEWWDKWWKLIFSWNIKELSNFDWSYTADAVRKFLKN